MIQILVVEDSVEKVERVVDVARRVLEERPHSIDTAPNLYEAKRLLASRAYEVVVLDLQLPRRAGDAAHPDTGIELLHLLDERGALFRPAYLIGLTAHRALLTKHASEFESRLWRLLEYERSSVDWERPLERVFGHLVERRSAVTRAYQSDLVILTALHSIELEAVLNIEARWRQLRIDGDESLYFEGEWHAGSRAVRVIAAASLDMGMPTAAAMTMKLLHQFRPRLMAMAGLAAGIEGTFGDVLVADQSWDYGSGKVREVGHSVSQWEPAPSVLSVSPSIKREASLLARDGTFLNRVREEWSGDAPVNPPQVRIGPMASGASVVQDSGVVARIRSHNRKLVGLEMEAFGVFSAAAIAPEPRPPVLVAKSICDHGDNWKNDQYQPYAAYTSARFVQECALRWIASSAQL